MSGVGQRILAVTPVAALLALVTGLGGLIAGLVGVVPAASAGRIAVSVAAAVFLGVAAAPLVRVSYAAAVGSAAEPPQPPQPPQPPTTTRPGGRQGNARASGRRRRGNGRAGLGLRTEVVAAHRATKPRIIRDTP